MRKLFRRILLILAFALILVILGAATASANSTHTFNNDKWSGAVTNLDWSQMTLDPDFSLDFGHPVWTAPWPLEFIKVPALKFSLQMKVGLSGTFDITIRQANLNDAVTLQRSYEKYMEKHVPFFTVQDDLFCTGDPIALYCKGDCVDVAMMAGCTSTEFPNTIDAKDETELKKEAARIFGEKAEQFLSFPESRKKVSGQGYAPVSGIGCTVKGVLSETAKNGKKGFVYCFDPDIPGWDNPGTFHSSDLWFWFETLAKCWRPFVGRHYDLARQMCDYFCNFVRSGDPNGKDLNGVELPRWEAWAAEAPCTMIFRGDGAAPSEEPVTPFCLFISERIVERIRGIHNS